MNKLEDHIKDKLTERKINPSEGAWEQVASNLSQPTKKPSRNGFWYYAIAASFVGFLSLGIFYSTLGDAPGQTEITTATEDKSVKPTQFREETREVPNGKTLGVEKVVAQEKNHVVQNIVEPEKTKESSFLEDSPKLKQVVVEEFGTEEDVLIAEKLNAVLAKVSSMEADNTLVTDAEVDSLLRIAQREILTDKALQKDGKVDAIALLEEVEGELDKSFRDQLFEKLKDGFFKVRTAVVDRNN